VASPRLCCAEETEEGNREAACAVEGSTLVESDETALGDGACRESIVRCGCAQLSETGEEVVGLRLELRYLGGGPKLQTQVIIDQECVDWLGDLEAVTGSEGDQLRGLTLNIAKSGRRGRPSKIMVSAT
jgi:hypothetical protein